MPRNGSGTMVRAAATAIVTGTTITKTWGDAMAADYVDALTASIANDGQTPVLADLPMGGFKHTGVDDATARTDYAAAGQVQDSAFLWGGTAGGTADALTISLTPVITAYATGQTYRCISSASANTTTTPTININGVGAKTFLRRDGAACAAGDIQASAVIEFVYDGTNMRLLDNIASVAQGGTGRATGTTAYGLVAAGTTATGAQQTLAAGAATEILVGGGAASLPVWTTATGSGAPVRATSPTLVTPALGTPSSGNLGSCTADGADAVGFRNIPQNSKSAAYTTVLTDAGKHIYHPGADTTARIWTIDSNANVAYPIGAAITFINDTLGGVITIAITSDTLVLAGTGSTGSRTLAASGMATAIKMTTTRWMISGSGLS